MAGTEVQAAAAQAGFARLLRFLAAGPAERLPAGDGDGGGTRLRRPDGTVRDFATALVRVALSRGLASEKDGCVALDDPGRSWLKRLLAGGDDAFAAQHGEREAAVVDVDGERMGVTVNVAESPLGMLMRLKDKSGRSFLGERAFLAGERLRADFARGGLEPRVTANWDATVSTKAARGPGGGIAELTDAALSARRRVEEALDAVGPELSGVLVDVCCFLKGLETVERERQWPVRSGKLMLKTALLALARHYDQRRSGTPRRGEENNRPELGER